MKSRILKKLSALTIIAAMLTGLTVSVSAGNDGLIGANIKDGELLGYYGNGGDIKIPDTVTVIAGEAFLNNDNVTSVTIPGSVQVIGYHAFDGCTELERVIFENYPTERLCKLPQTDRMRNSSGGNLCNRKCIQRLHKYGQNNGSPTKSILRHRRKRCYVWTVGR